MEVRMGRTVRALAAVALMFLIAVMLSKRLPAPAANGQARRCEIRAESPRPLHLDRFADRAHLRTDSATGELGHRLCRCFTASAAGRRSLCGRPRPVHGDAVREDRSEP